MQVNYKIIDSEIMKKTERTQGLPRRDSAPLGDDDHQRERRLNLCPLIDGHNKHS